ncbi:hypothetical protein ACI3L3_11210 [Desulfobaculum sp. SPO524]|uniref:hypothetical protein n=1 Tax=Desulfobaculum sp. SPO524 TaxID=3378071 RepID=UPI003851ABE1
MNKGFQVAVGFQNHRKVTELRAHFGPEGVLALLSLWEQAAICWCDGIYRDANRARLAAAARVDSFGERFPRFVETLIWLGFIDVLTDDVRLEVYPDDKARLKALNAARVRGVFESVGEVAAFLDAAEADGHVLHFALHNWIRHNAWASRAAARRRRAEQNAHRRWAGHEHADSTANCTASHNAQAEAAPDERAGALGSAAGTALLLKSIKSKTRKSKKSDRSFAPSSGRVSSSLPAFCVFPTNRKGHDVAIPIAKVREWQETYPAVDVEQELRACRQWNIDNPRRRKTADGVYKHINAWLARSQNRARPIRQNEASSEERVPESFSDEELRRMREEAQSSPEDPLP